MIVDEGIDLLKDGALDSFADMDYMAFSDSIASDDATNTTLTDEIVRVALVSATKNLSAGTYTFIARLSLSQANGTITKMALFDASSGGNMGVEESYSDSFVKTSDDEIWTTFQVTVGVANA